MSVWSNDNVGIFCNICYSVYGGSKIIIVFIGIAKKVGILDIHKGYMALYCVYGLLCWVYGSLIESLDLSYPNCWFDYGLLFIVFEE